MSFVRFVVVAASLVALSACQRAPTEPQGPGALEASGDPCGANDLSFMTGMRVGEVQFDTVDRPVRIVGPRSAVTLDHRPNRLNVSIDASERITGFRCG